MADKPDPKSAAPARNKRVDIDITNGNGGDPPAICP
jgi:hypothetical protein